MNKRTNIVLAKLFITMKALTSFMVPVIRVYFGIFLKISSFFYLLLQYVAMPTGVLVYG